MKSLLLFLVFGLIFLSACNDNVTDYSEGHIRKSLPHNTSHPMYKPSLNHLKGNEIEKIEEKKRSAEKIRQDVESKYKNIKYKSQFKDDAFKELVSKLDKILGGDPSKEGEDKESLDNLIKKAKHANEKDKQKIIDTADVRASKAEDTAKEHEKILEDLFKGSLVMEDIEKAMRSFRELEKLVRKVSDEDFAKFFEEKKENIEKPLSGIGLNYKYYMQDVDHFREVAKVIKEVLNVVQDQVKDGQEISLSQVSRIINLENKNAIIDALKKMETFLKEAHQKAEEIN